MITANEMIIKEDNMSNYPTSEEMAKIAKALKKILESVFPEDRHSDDQDLMIEIQAIISDSNGVIVSAGESVLIKYDTAEDTPDSAYLNLSDAVYSCWNPITKKIHKEFYEWARDKCVDE